MQESSQSALGRDLARLHLAESGNLFGFPMQTRFYAHITMLKHEVYYVSICYLSIWSCSSYAYLVDWPPFLRFLEFYIWRDECSLDDIRVGIVSLDNRWSLSWSEFFIEQRLRDRFQVKPCIYVWLYLYWLCACVLNISRLQLVSTLRTILTYLQRVYERLGEDKTALEVKGAMVLEKANTLLKYHNPKPSVLHGDLWVSLRQSNLLSLISRFVLISAMLSLPSYRWFTISPDGQFRASGYWWSCDFWSSKFHWWCWIWYGLLFAYLIDLRPYTTCDYMEQSMCSFRWFLVSQCLFSSLH